MFAVKVSVWAELWVWLSGCGLQELLTAQNCAEAFWVGNLKNRDIRVRTHTIHILLTHSHTHAHTHAHTHTHTHTHRVRRYFPSRHRPTQPTGTKKKKEMERYTSVHSQPSRDACNAVCVTEGNRGWQQYHHSQ